MTPAKKEHHTPGNVSDAQLVKLAQSGDKGAYTHLVRRHQANCSKVAFAILRDWPDAEDEVQNALWQAFQQIGQFKQDSQFSTWLTRIVINQCLTRLRQTRQARLLSLTRREEART
jgi:RNA polymerase sigma-70 factor (ECF subfamily)